MWHLRRWFRDNRNKFRFSKFTSCPLLPTSKNFLTAPSHCSFVFASPHIFPILYSSYVICLFCTSRIYFIFSLAMISFNHIHLFFSFLKANLLFFNSFCFFSLSPAVVILYRESFLMYSFFSLSLHPHQTTMAPSLLTRTPYPFKSHRNLSSRWAPEGNIKRVMSGL